MAFPLLITVACVFASWAVLSLLTGERQRRLDVIEFERKSAEAKAEYEKAAAAAMRSMVPIAPAAKHSGR
jgi:hypothetical protein